MHIKQNTRFCGKKQSFKMFTDIFPTMYIEAQGKSTKSIKINTFTCFAYRGGMALPTTYMTHPTYHTLQMVSLYYFLQVVYSQKVSPRRNYTFTSSIRLASSQPGIERTRKRAESWGKLVKCR